MSLKGRFLYVSERFFISQQNCPPWFATCTKDLLFIKLLLKEFVRVVTKFLGFVVVVVVVKNMKIKGKLKARLLWESYIPHLYF